MFKFLQITTFASILSATTIPANCLAESGSLPLKAQITFNVFKGNGSFQLGVAKQTLVIKQQNYEISSITESSGLASMLKSYRLTQNSRGTTNGYTLKPTQFSEDKINGSKQQSQNVKFDWPNNTLTLTNGTQLPLPADTQDALSFFYQFSQLKPNTKLLQLHLTNGKKLDQYKLEVSAEESLETPAGRLRTIRLRKIHSPGSEGTEVWLALDHHNLPVKIRHFDKDGDVSGEMRLIDLKVNKN